MSKIVQWKRGNANVSSSYTGLDGEITVDTSVYGLRVHDGLTPGGHIISSGNVGNLHFIDQTITGTNSNANIYINPLGTGITIISSEAQAANLNFVNTAISATTSNAIISIISNDPGGVVVANTRIFAVGPLGPLLITSPELTNSNLVTITTAGRSNGNIGLQLRGSLAGRGIEISARNSNMGFNAPPSAGYNYNFNGSMYAREYYAEQNFPTGYQFNTTDGDTGFSHYYSGNVSVIRIRHAGTPVAKFIDNLTTQLSGSLVVSATGNEFGSFPNAFIQSYANVNSYSQVVNQNINSGAQSSSDFVVTANDGTDSTYYGDFGIASNTFSYTGYGLIRPHDVYLLSVGNDYTGPSTGAGPNLVIGSSNGNIKFFVGATEEANVVAQIGTAGFIPGTNVAYSLGSSSRQWKDIWTGNVTAAGNITGNTAGYTIGYRDVPQVVFSSNATLALADAGKHYFSSNSANVITIPNNTTVSFSIGTQISIVQQGTANLTVSPASGVSLYLAGNSVAGSRTVGSYGLATLLKVATNTWFIRGSGVV